MVDEHDAVAGLAGAKMVECIVDFRHREGLSCVIFDALIAIWFWAGAPSLVKRRSQVPSHYAEQPLRQETTV